MGAEKPRNNVCRGRTNKNVHRDIVDPTKGKSMKRGCRWRTSFIADTMKHVLQKETQYQEDTDDKHHCRYYKTYTTKGKSIPRGHIWRTSL